MDSIFGIGLPELFFIAILSLIILGPERLPGTLRQIAKGWGYMRNLGRELTAQFSEEFKDLQDLNPRKLLNDLADEELAKDIKSLNDNMKKTTPATKAIATTTKPSSSTAAKSNPAKATTAKVPPAKSGTTDAPAKTTKAAETTPTATSVAGAKPPPQSEPATTAKAEATADNGGEQTILPPTGEAEIVNSAADLSANLTPMTTVAPVSVNGASDLAESAG